MSGISGIFVDNPPRCSAGDHWNLPFFRNLRRICHNLQGWCQECARTDQLITSSPPSAPPSTTSWRVAAAHVLRAAAHGVCAFGVDLAPTVHVYLGPVDNNSEGAIAAGCRRRRTGAELHYSNSAGDDPGAAPRRATPTGGPDAANVSAAAAATDRRWLLGRRRGRRRPFRVGRDLPAARDAARRARVRRCASQSTLTALARSRETTRS